MEVDKVRIFINLQANKRKIDNRIVAFSLRFQKKVFNKVKHDLEVYRELLLILNSVLKWEQSFFPGIIGGVLTIQFLFLWYIDLSALTLVALVALLVTVVDYGYPLVSKFIFKAENWSGTQEKLYEQVIQDIVDVRLCVCGAICSFFSNRSERSTFVSHLFLLHQQRYKTSTLFFFLVSHHSHCWLDRSCMDRINIQQSFLGVLDDSHLGYVSRLEGERYHQVGI